MTTIAISETTKDSPWMTLNQAAKYFVTQDVTQRAFLRDFFIISCGFQKIFLIAETRCSQ